MSQRAVLAELFLNPLATPTALHVALLDRLGTQIYEFDPETLALEINSEYHTEPSEENLEKLHAIVTAVSTDAFYKLTQGFYTIATAIEDGSPRFSVFEPISLPEALWAVYEVGLNRDPDEFSPSVKQFLQNLVAEEGASSSYSEEDPDNDQLGLYLTEKRERVKTQLAKLKGTVPELPAFSDILSPALD